MTRVGNGTFSYYSWLVSVTISDSVIHTWDNFFYEFIQLTSSVVFPSSEACIGKCAFYDCSKLRSISIPDSVTYIGNVPFYRCSQPTSVVILDFAKATDYALWYDCLELEQRWFNGCNYNAHTITWFHQRFTNLPLCQAFWKTTNTIDTSITTLVATMTTLYAVTWLTWSNILPCWG